MTLDYVVKDINLAEFDRKKFDIAETEMPRLMALREEFGGKMPEFEIEKVVAKIMDLSPRGIIEHLKLRRPIYQRTSTYGHFGRSPDDDGGFSWKKLDLLEAIRRIVWKSTPSCIILPHNTE